MNFLDEKNGIAVGGAGKILRTTNGGEEWVQETIPIPANQLPNLIGINFKSPNKALTATWTGIILGWQKGISTTEEDQTTLRSVQVAPIPASSHITFSIELPQQKFMQATLYDMIGQKICTMIQPRYLDAGPHTIATSVAKVPAGIYYCQVLLGDQKIIRSVVVAR